VEKWRSAEKRKVQQRKSRGSDGGKAGGPVRGGGQRKMGGNTINGIAAYREGRK